MAQVRGLAANGSAILWRTLCAATGDCGFRRWGPRYHGEQVCILWRTLCAATGGTGFGAGRTKCRDRSGEHCSPWPFVRRGAYRPGRDVCPAAVLRRTGPHFCGEHCAPLQGARGLAQVRGFTAHGSAFCGAQCAPLQGGGFAAHGAVPDFSRTGPDSIVHYQGGVQVEPRWSSDEDSKQSMNKL